VHIIFIAQLKARIKSWHQIQRHQLDCRKGCCNGRGGAHTAGSQVRARCSLVPRGGRNMQI